MSRLDHLQLVYEKRREAWDACVRELGDAPADERALALVAAAHRFGTPAEWKKAADGAMEFAVSRSTQFGVRLARVRASLAIDDVETAAADVEWFLASAKDSTPKARQVVAELVAAISVPGMAPALRRLLPVAEETGMAPLVDAKILELEQLQAFISRLPPRRTDRSPGTSSREDE
jgi:hypothetical protein